MTTLQLENKIERVKKEIKKGERNGFKKHSESDLHCDLDTLRKSLSMLEKFESQMKVLKTF